MLDLTPPPEIILLPPPSAPPPLGESERVASFFKAVYLIILFFILVFLRILFWERAGIFLSWRFLLIYLWLAVVWAFSLSGRVTLVVGLIFLLSLPAVFLFPGEAEIERPAIMSLAFLALGIGQLFWEAWRSPGRDTDDEA